MPASWTWRPRFFQSNSEGEFVEHLHRLPEPADAALINAAASTTTRGRSAMRSI